MYVYKIQEAGTLNTEELMKLNVMGRCPRSKLSLGSCSFFNSSSKRVHDDLCGLQTVIVGAVYLRGEIFWVSNQ